MRLVPVGLRLRALLVTLTLAQAPAPSRARRLSSAMPPMPMAPLPMPATTPPMSPKPSRRTASPSPSSPMPASRPWTRPIAAFGEALKQKGGVGLFYFSGHGVQVAGENYMLPIGDALEKESDVKYKAVAAGQVIDAMAGNTLNIVILDSCRNNPLAAGSRGGTRGLARVEGGSGLFVSFATSPGAVAEDGDGRNSPYTKHLLAALEDAGSQSRRDIQAHAEGRLTARPRVARRRGSRRPSSAISSSGRPAAPPRRRRRPSLASPSSRWPRPNRRRKPPSSRPALPTPPASTGRTVSIPTARATKAWWRSRRPMRAGPSPGGSASNASPAAAALPGGCWSSTGASPIP